MTAVALLMLAAVCLSAGFVAGGFYEHTRPGGIDDLHKALDAARRRPPVIVPDDVTVRARLLRQRLDSLIEDVA